MVYIHCSVRVSFEDKLKVMLITGLDFCIYGLDLEYEQIIWVSYNKYEEHSSQVGCGLDRRCTSPIPNFVLKKKVMLLSLLLKNSKMSNKQKSIVADDI